MSKKFYLAGDYNAINMTDSKLFITKPKQKRFQFTFKADFCLVNDEMNYLNSVKKTGKTHFQWSLKNKLLTNSYET